jgi:serine phosphatase RsbU (regulator of sigma subunit)
MAVHGSEKRLDALRSLTGGARDAVLAGASEAALSGFAEAALDVFDADVVVVREHVGDELTARAIHASSPARAALVAGSRAPIDSLEASDETLHLAAQLGDELLGSLELRRPGSPFDQDEVALAEIAADQLALVLRAVGTSSPGTAGRVEVPLLLAAHAMVAAADEQQTAVRIARVAAESAGADAALLWGSDGRLLASHGVVELEDGVLAQAALRALGSHDFLSRVDAAGTHLFNARLGEPAVGVLQLCVQGDAALEGLGTFALRAAQALRAAERNRATALELDRARVLLDVIAGATGELSLAHTLSTTVDRVTSLLGVKRVAVYLADGAGRLLAAAGHAVAGPHEAVAEGLLGLLNGPYRGRGIVVVDALAREPRLADVHSAAAEAGIVSAVALPLVVDDESIGLLAIYPPPRRAVTEHERALLAALAGQLGVAVRNASAHERALRRTEELATSLVDEQRSARRVRALYEVSRSFAQSLSLQAVLDSLATSSVELLDVDAAAIRMADPRREQLTTVALHVADTRLDAAARTILGGPQPFGARPLQGLLRTRRPLPIDQASARELGGSYSLLVPFLEKGSTAALVPIATPAEVVATLTIVSFDPGRPIGSDAIETAESIAVQAALAIDNGRLYQQQKHFADTIQRALLPRTHPELEGLEIGEVYDSSARVDVGGDVYDFLELGDGRLAVVLGDVTGHGIDATADMAMAKFVFRSLAREHPEPGEFLAAANDVVVGEIAPGKFITMAYLTIDSRDGSIVAASAGHPAPLVVSLDGEVRPLDVAGLALGIESGQDYDVDRTVLAPGSSVVVFTDGVIEARKDGELYGSQRLARALSEHRRLPPRQLARAIVDDCRTFAGGELGDDCAVVVIRRTP